jgi:hypothetical protein
VKNRFIVIRKGHTMTSATPSLPSLRAPRGVLYRPPRGVAAWFDPGLDGDRLLNRTFTVDQLTDQGHGAGGSAAGPV